MDAELGAHLTTGAVIVYGIEWLKAQGWCPWITADSTRINRLVSAGAAIIAVVGINVSYDPSLGGTVTIPPLTVLLTGLWELAKQYTTQQLIYDGVVQKRGTRS